MPLRPGAARLGGLEPVPAGSPPERRPEATPTLSGMIIAAGTGLSANLWPKQYGDWTQEEMTSLEATALLLAEHINRLTGDRAYPTRLIAKALPSADQG